MFALKTKSPRDLSASAMVSLQQVRRKKEPTSGSVFFNSTSRFWLSDVSFSRLSAPCSPGEPLANPKGMGWNAVVGDLQLAPCSLDTFDIEGQTREMFLKAAPSQRRDFFEVVPTDGFATLLGAKSHT